MRQLNSRKLRLRKCDRQRAEPGGGGVQSGVGILVKFCNFVLGMCMVVHFVTIPRTVYILYMHEYDMHTYTLIFYRIFSIINLKVDFPMICILYIFCIHNIMQLQSL